MWWTCLHRPSYLHIQLSIIIIRHDNTTHTHQTSCQWYWQLSAYRAASPTTIKCVLSCVCVLDISLSSLCCSYLCGWSPAAVLWSPPVLQSSCRNLTPHLPAEDKIFSPSEEETSCETNTVCEFKQVRLDITTLCISLMTVYKLRQNTQNLKLCSLTHF